MQCCWIALIKLHSRTSKLEPIFSKPATTLSTEFMSFCNSFVVISHVVLVVKNLSANAGNIRDVGLIPGFRKSPREGHGNPLQCMLAWKIPWTEVPGGLQSMVHRAEPDWSWLSMQSMHWPEDLSPLWCPLYRAAWVSLSWHGSQISPKPPIQEIKVGTKISAFHDLAAESSQVRRGKESTCPCRRRKRWGFNPRVGKMPWSGKWQSTPVFLAGESHGQRSPVGYSPWSHRRVKHDWVTEDAWKQ